MTWYFLVLRGLSTATYVNKRFIRVRLYSCKQWNTFEIMEIKQEPVDYEDVEQIRGLLEREFAREIDEREEEILKIETRIQHCKRFIHFVKYSAVSCLYQKEKVEDDDVEVGIHPCVKKFLKEQCEMPENVSVEQPVVNDLKPPEKTVSDKIEENVMVVRGTYRVRHQIVVGNISKWQGSKEDGATHKWMVYVRDKTDENWGKLVKKVRYFLHDSYKPHDIVDVSSWPFSLTRRGWGEFPVRLTIFFKNAANKPVDFIHQLRLDHTCSGSDQLGGETVFEVDLFHEDLKIPEDVEQPEIGEQNVSAMVTAFSEHSYCKAREDEDGDNDDRATKRTCLKQMSSNALSVGADTSEMEALAGWNLQMDGPIVAWYENDVVRRLSGTAFFTTEAAVKWFLQRWPLVTANANNPRYRAVHAYSFPTPDAYVAAPQVRRFAAEWYRAFKIRSLLDKLSLTLWTTKQILLYARMHGYTVVLTKQSFLPDIFPKCCTFSADVDADHDMRLLEVSNTAEIDVLSEETEKVPLVNPVKKATFKFSSEWASIADTFSREIGIRFGDEEIDNNLVANVSSTILGHVLKLFLDELLRKSLCNAWLRNGKNNPGTLEPGDIVKSILENPEFDILTNVGLGSKI